MGNNFWDANATAASNTTIGGIGAAGTNSVSNFDNIVREIHAQGKRFALDLGGANTVGGTADAITVTTNQTIAALADGLLVAFVAGTDNATTIPTLNVDGLGAKVIEKCKASDGAETALAAGDIQAGGLYFGRYRSAWASAAGAFQLIDLNAVNPRERLIASRTYYVRADGNDSNSGLVNNSGGAFLTIQKAVDVVFGTLDIGGQTVTIQVDAGTYTGAISINSPQVGTGTIQIVGDTTTPSNVHISTAATPLTVIQGAKITVDGLKFSTSGNSQILCESGATVTLKTRNEFAGSAAHRIVADFCGVIYSTGEEIISGTVPGAHYQTSGGAIYSLGATWTASGTATQAAFVGASAGGLVSAFANSSSGTFVGARYYANLNGVATSNGGGASYFPGSTAGVTATGGQYG